MLMFTPPWPPTPPYGEAATEAAASCARNSEGCCGVEEEAVEEVVDGGENKLEEAALGGRSESLVSGESCSGGVTPGEERPFEPPTPPTPPLLQVNDPVVDGTRRETL